MVKFGEEARALHRMRRLEAMNLHRIEGNPLDAEDIALFEMFDREGWLHEQRRAYIIALALNEEVPSAAE